MKNFKDFFLNILYPRHCPVCHKILKNQNRMVCPECAEVLVPISGSRCMKCSKPVAEEEELCVECEHSERVFTEGLGIFFYDEKVKYSMLQFKYFGRREYGDFFAFLLGKYAIDKMKRWRPDLIVPIPLFKRKQRMRGFNQAVYLARRIGEYYHMPVEEHVLCKVRNTKSQKKLDAKRRKKNLKDAFEVSKRLDGLNIVLIDDVYTTGSTMDAAALCLKENGAKCVFFLTFAIGQR